MTMYQLTICTDIFLFVSLVFNLLTLLSTRRTRRILKEIIELRQKQEDLLRSRGLI